jgi:hypothetical protein
MGNFKENEELNEREKTRGGKGSRGVFEFLEALCKI